jgi:hypothetical protein
MDLKEHADKLMKLAAKIEKEASEYTFFICSSCNHTASLMDINNRRVKMASLENPEMTVNPVTVNDAVSCPVPECEGTMNYIATENSEKYYTDEKDAGKDDMLEVDEPSTDEPKEEEPKAEAPKEDNKDIDKEIDDLFEDVETQNENSKKEKADRADTIQKARHEKKQEETSLAEKDDKDVSQDPKSEDPMVDPVVKTEPEPAAIKEDEEPKEEKPKPKKKKEPIDLEKKDVPKFKSKEASERYQSSVSRYSI